MQRTQQLLLLLTFLYAHNIVRAFVAPSTGVYTHNWHEANAKPTRPTTEHYMTVALPSPVSISIGPLQHSWYEDVGTGFGRKVVYDDDDDLPEFTFARFGYDGKIKSRSSFGDLLEEPMEEPVNYRHPLRRAFVRVRNLFGRRH